MNKSILVIDTPEKCIDCPCSYFIECDFTEGTQSDYCIVTDSEIDDLDGILEDCPLKKLPQIRPCNYYDFEHYNSGYDRGWNDCIDYLNDKGRWEKKQEKKDVET